MSPLAASTRLVTAALALLTLALLAPSAHAQGLAPGVSVTLDETRLDVEAANTTLLTGTVTYTDTAPALGGQTDGQITLSLTTPDGWTATLEPPTFTLAPGGVMTFELTLTAPAAGEGAATGELGVTADATSATGATAQSTPATLTLNRVDPPVVVPPWYQTPGGIAAIAGATLLVLGLAAYAAHRRRQKRLAAEAAARDAAERAAWLDRETGVTLALAGGPLQYGHRREVVYRIAIINQSPRPRVAILDIADISNGWRAATQVSKLPLSVGETQHVTLVVTPDAVITPGDKATVTLRVKPEEAREKDERMTLEVIAPKSGVPNDPHYRIVTVHREGAGIRQR